MWHPEAASERDESWPAREKVAMLHAAQKLEAAGPRLGHPHSSAVRGELGPSTFVIFAVGPEAEIDSRGYEAAVARAAERFGQLEVD